MQERAIKTKQRILDGAIKLFAKYGYRGTSVDLIATAANANKQRIYQYFGNKERLFQSCLIEVFAKSNRAHLQIIPKLADDGSDLTIMLFNNYMQYHRKHGVFWRLLSWANLDATDFSCALEHINDEFYTQLRVIYANGQQNGHLQRDMDFDSYIFLLYAASYFYHSNAKTLPATIGAELFAPTGEKRLISTLVKLLSQSQK